MKTQSESSQPEPKDVGLLICDLWDIEEKIKALGLLFKNFSGGGNVIEDAEHLVGMGSIFNQIAGELRTVIMIMDGKEFAVTKSPES